MDTEFSDLQKIYATEIVFIRKMIEDVLASISPDSLREPCIYAFRKEGKYLRPLLILLSAKAVGGDFSQVYNAAVAAELGHTFTLIHDDIMDHSEKRRGQKTMHLQYDINTAILTGDNLFVLAYDNLLKDCSEKNAKEIISFSTQAGIKVCQGQSLDLEFETKSHVTLEEYMDMIYKKTAASMENCCRTGALLCGAMEAYSFSLAEYGKNIGIAFQIQDDYLDIAGDELIFGKPIGNDLSEKKKTYIFLRALEKITGEDRDLLLKIIHTEDISQAEIDSYRELCKKSGVLDDAKEEIREYTKEAIKNLSILPNNTGKQLLETLAQFLFERNR